MASVMVFGAWIRKALASGVMLTTIGLPTMAAADDFQFPYIVRCNTAGIDQIYYLSSVRENGVAVYVGASKQVAIITATGTPVKIQSEEAAGNCAGKTVDELRDEGLAIFLK